METRTERYAKYREEIKRMPDSVKPGASSSKMAEVLASQDSSSAITFGAALTPMSAKNSAPYRINLKRKRIAFVLKALAFLVVVAGFVLWWYFLQGRKPV